VAIDSAGSVYVAGETGSPDFPVRAAWQSAFGGYTDAFLTKFDATGAIAWSTYFGGDGGDRAQALTIGPDGNVYVAGTTSSSNLPVLGGLRKGLGGMDDVFVARFSPSGQLQYSTYLGGSGYEVGAAIAVDPSGAMYVAGQTFSTDLPVHRPYQRRLSGVADAFVAKIDAGGSRLAYSTYLGGSVGDAARAIAVDASGAAYVAGSTYSEDFPTVNAFQATRRGSQDGFVAKLAPNGTALTWATYLGGGGDNVINGIALDGLGRAYVAGQTTADDFPVTSGALQADCGQSNFCTYSPDAFFARLGTTGQLELASFLGGTSDDGANGIALDASGSIWLTGYSYSDDFQTYAPTPDGTAFTDVFVARIAPAGDAVLAFTFLGGSDYEAGTAVAADAAGRGYVTGWTRSTNFPVTSTAADASGGGTGCPEGNCMDSFIAILAP
jgi:hypothetical protein